MMTDAEPMGAEDRDMPDEWADGPESPSMLTKVLMLLFWALLGAAAGVNAAQGLWRQLGWLAGNVTVAVPIGAAAGAVIGALLGLVTRPRLLVLLMAVFA